MLSLQAAAVGVDFIIDNPLQAVKEGAVRLCAIFNNGYASCLCQFQDRIHIRRFAGDMGDDNRSGLGRQHCRDLCGVGVKRSRRRIGHHRHLAQ